ncbi:hypothetical protein HDU93_004669 [Gonapodya sp. JEL0774]|nr:hypothetical protein HDU93_004669 [Gonapodya sp. JEL0774]
MSLQERRLADLLDEERRLLAATVLSAPPTASPGENPELQTTAIPPSVVEHRNLADLATYLEQTRAHRHMMETYWPVDRMTDSERIQASANRVGLNLPKMFQSMHEDEEVEGEAETDVQETITRGVDSDVDRNLAEDDELDKLEAIKGKFGIGVEQRASSILSRLSAASTDLLKRANSVQDDLTTKILPRVNLEIDSISRDAARAARELHKLRDLATKTCAVSMSAEGLDQDSHVLANPNQGSESFTTSGVTQPSVRITVLGLDGALDGDSNVSGAKINSSLLLADADELATLHTARLNLTSTLDALSRSQRWSLLPGEARSLAADGEWERAADRLLELATLVDSHAELGQSTTSLTRTSARPDDLESSARRALLDSLATHLCSAMLPDLIASSSRPSDPTPRAQLDRIRGVAVRVGHGAWFDRKYAVARSMDVVSSCRADIESDIPDAVPRGLHLLATLAQDEGLISDPVIGSSRIVAINAVISTAMASVSRSIAGWVKRRLAELDSMSPTTSSLAHQSTALSAWPDLCAAFSASDSFIRSVESAQGSPLDVDSDTDSPWLSLLLRPLVPARSRSDNLERAHLRARIAGILQPATTSPQNLTLVARARLLPSRIASALSEASQTASRCMEATRGRSIDTFAEAAASFVSEVVLSCRPIAQDAYRAIVLSASAGEAQHLVVGNSTFNDMRGGDAFIVAIGLVALIRDAESGVENVETEFSRVSGLVKDAFEGTVGRHLAEVFGAVLSEDVSIHVIVLEAARGALSNLLGDAHGAILAAFLAPMEKQIEAHGAMAVWNPIGAGQSPTEPDAGLSFSLTPSTPATRLGEHLLGLPQLLVSLAESPTEGPALAYRACDLPNLEDDERAEVEAAARDAEATRGQIDPAVVARAWLSAVAKGCMISFVARAVEAVAPDGRESKSLGYQAAKQMGTDAGYLANVISALDVEVTAGLRALEGACGDNEEEVKRLGEVWRKAEGGMAEGGRKVFDRVCTVRGLRFDL